MQALITYCNTFCITSNCGSTHY